MKKYNRYQHCGETFYTGTDITQIKCSECGENIKRRDIVKTEDAMTDEEVNIVETIKPEEN